MKSLTLTKISDKLISLAEEEEELYPEFYEAELKLTNLKAKLMMSDQIMGLAAQPLRDAELNRLLVLTPEYEKYHIIAPTMHVHEVQTRIYLQIARNLNTASFNQ